VAPRISLALAIHNHQPVGNFGWVVAEAYDVAYEPMVAALELHPGVRLSLHYTGSLLDWLRRERPAFVERLGALVAAIRSSCSAAVTTSRCSRRCRSAIGSASCAG
jgi:alpha-amylase/alpha-mannosidase (GH57 family)